MGETIVVFDSWVQRGPKPLYLPSPETRHRQLSDYDDASGCTIRDTRVRSGSDLLRTRLLLLGQPVRIADRLRQEA